MLKQGATAKTNKYANKKQLVSVQKVGAKMYMCRDLKPTLH